MNFKSVVFILTLSLSVWAGNYSGGDGTTVTPYQISTSVDWQELTYPPTGWSGNFVLTKDVDLSLLTSLTPDTITYSGFTKISLLENTAGAIQIEIYSLVARTINWTVTGAESCSWIADVNPDTGIVSPSVTAAVIISIDPNGLTPGNYSTELSLNPDTGNSVPIPIYLYVTDEQETFHYIGFRFSNETTAYPVVAIDPNSQRYVFVWQDFDNQDSDNLSIYASIFDYDQRWIVIRQGIEDQYGVDCNTPAISINSHSKFVTAWSSPDSDENGIYARLMNIDANSLTEVFPVNDITVGQQLNPQVAMNDQGRIAAVWTSGQDYQWKIAGRLFDDIGHPLGSEFDVTTEPNSISPKVAMHSDGSFAVTWITQSGLSEYKLGLQIFDPNGDPEPNAVYIQETNYELASPDIDMMSDGSMIVVWGAAPSVVTDSEIYAQRFDLNGNALTSVFIVNEYSFGRQELPSVSVSQDDDFIIVWQSEEADGNDFGICGRKYTPDATAYDSEFTINTYYYRKQHHPDVAYNGGDNFLAAWIHDEQLCWDDYGETVCRDTPHVHAQAGLKPYLSCSCQGTDLTSDGYIDFNDLIALAEKWLTWHSDFSHIGNADGQIDMADFTGLNFYLNTCCKDLHPSIAEAYKPYCQARLRNIGISIILYQNQNRDQNPPDLDTLILETDLSPEKLTCPLDCPDIDGESYAYRGADLNASAHSDLILAYDKYENHGDQSRNVLFANCRVETMTEAEFQAAIDWDNEYRRNTYNLAEKPVPWGGN